MKDLEKRTNIDQYDYKQDIKLIHQNKQGDKKAETKSAEVTMVRNLSEFVQKVVKAESEFLKHVTQVEGAVSVDAGRKRVISEHTLLNRKDKKVKPHSIVLFDGTDNYHYLSVTIETLRDQIKDLNNSTIKVHNKFVRFKMKTIVDGIALSTIIGQQGASASAPCPWTNVTINHLRNHENNNHTPENCPDIKFLTNDDFRENLNGNVI